MIGRRTLLVVGLVAAGLAVTSTSSRAESKRVQLTFELPRPMFVGTPKQLKSPNLEPARVGKPRPFFVPEGSQNVAAGKTVTSSDMEPIIGDLELVTDGDKEGSDGSYVELGPGKQYAQIDLGETYTIHAVVVWHYHSQARVYRDVVLQIAGDPDFVLDVETVYNNDHDNSAGLGMGKDKEYIETYTGRILDAKGAKGRYVRLYSNGSTSGEMNHYTEVEVYATAP